MCYVYLLEEECTHASQGKSRQSADQSAAEFPLKSGQPGRFQRHGEDAWQRDGRARVEKRVQGADHEKETGERLKGKVCQNITKHLQQNDHFGGNTLYE